MTDDETHEDFALPGEADTPIIELPRPVQDGLRYGCLWHGPKLTDHCAECGMLKFWRAELDAGRAVISA
jgi:hypothetical protein